MKSGKVGVEFSNNLILRRSLYTPAEPLMEADMPNSVEQARSLGWSIRHDDMRRQVLLVIGCPIQFPAQSAEIVGKNREFCAFSPRTDSAVISGCRSEESKDLHVSQPYRFTRNSVYYEPGYCQRDPLPGQGMMMDSKVISYHHDSASRNQEIPEALGEGHA